MKILVDADACPVKSIIVNIAKKENIPVIMFFDTSHCYNDGYSLVKTVDKGPDSVDFAIINCIDKGDICITQDYGLAVMAMSKLSLIHIFFRRRSCLQFQFCHF